MFTVTTIRERLSQAGRVVEVVQRQPSWVTKAALTAGFLAMGAVALVLIVPAILLMLIVFFIGAGIAAAKSFFTRSKQPNGLLDGRKNVRVVGRNENP